MSIALSVYCLLDLFRNPRPYAYMWAAAIILIPIVGGLAYIVVYKVPEWKAANPGMGQSDGGFRGSGYT